MTRDTGSPCCRVPGHRLAWCVLSLIIGTAAVAQEKLSIQETGTIRIDSDVLQEEVGRVPDMDQYALGIDLVKQSATRIILADDTTLAARDLDGRSWPVLHKDSSNVDAATPYWMRFPISPGAELKGRSLTLNVVARAPVDLYLNGVVVLRSAQRPLGYTGRLEATPEDFHPMVVQIAFACDGRPEMLAARVHGMVMDSPLRQPIHLVLQSEQHRHVFTRLGIHFGLCIGVNLIIALLAFIIWISDRRERSWLLLVLLALLTAFGVLSNLGAPQVLGFSPSLAAMMDQVRPPLFAWKMLLLLLVLRDLGGDPIGRFLRRWVGPSLVLTVVFVANLFIPGSMDMTWVEVPLKFIQLVTFIGLIVEVIRAAIRLMRMRGLEQWFSIGALTFTLILFVREVLVIFNHSFGTKAVFMYFWYLSVPVSAAIYMALRSARNNRLVARQRDELDVEVHERTAELRHEKERSDDLLRNILPEEVAEELKNTGAAQAKHFDTVTILFTDFKGFTQASEKLTPQELVEELNTCFKAFDGIVTARGIEKIKTIGDAYMCAGGLPDPKTSSPLAVVHAALEMRHFMVSRKAERDEMGLPAFEMRVGIHSGPVVAGIVGVKKFQYDIWGDTVNTASRMESSGEVGQVNISESTYALVKSEPGLTFTARGKVQAKGKGALEMYFVGRSEEGTQEDLATRIQ